MAAPGPEAPIVCGVDFTAPAREGMFAAAALASCAGRRLVLVHAREGSWDSDAEARLVEESDRILVSARVRADRTLVIGEPEDALAAVAEAAGAVLIVLGSPGHGGALLFGPSSVSEKLAGSAWVPLLVVRQAEPFVRWASGEQALRVVVGVDDTPATREALRWLEGLRRLRPCDVIVAHVFDALGPVPEEPKDLAARFGTLEGGGSLAYRSHPGFGRIADDLLRVADGESADLLVIGSHRRRGVAKLWSVAGSAIHLARMAVACVPEPRRA